LDLIRAEVDHFYRRFAVDPDLLELRNIVLVAGIVLRLAAARHETRGLHVNRDFPEPNNLYFRRDSVLGRVGDVSWGASIPDAEEASE
jgi:succinate dehydrogenase/fumarate reductase flavoprotein subunit